MHRFYQWIVLWCILVPGYGVKESPGSDRRARSGKPFPDRSVYSVKQDFLLSKSWIRACDCIGKLLLFLTAIWRLFKQKLPKPKVTQHNENPYESKVSAFSRNVPKSVFWDSDSEGHRFESCRVHMPKKLYISKLLGFFYAKKIAVYFIAWRLFWRLLCFHIK